MTDRSVNGWIVLPNYPPDSASFVAPGGKRVYCNSPEVAIVLEDFALWWHTNIEPIAVSAPINRQRPRERYGTTPDGKWDAVGIHSWRNGTKIAGTNVWSTHCSATGMDINGHIHPYEYTSPKPYRDGFTQKQRDMIRAKCKTSGVLRHGIDFSPGRRDGMHVELAPGISRDQVKAAALKILASRVVTLPVAVVKEIQSELNYLYGAQINVDGKYGPTTEKAVKVAQITLGVVPDGTWGANTTTAHERFVMGIAEDIKALSGKVDALATNQLTSVTFSPASWADITGEAVDAPVTKSINWVLQLVMRRVYNGLRATRSVEAAQAGLRVAINELGKMTGADPEQIQRLTNEAIKSAQVQLTIAADDKGEKEA